MRVNHKRYLIFVYSEYYPSGGMDDVVDSYDDLNIAIAKINELVGEYAYIYDRIIGSIVYDKMESHV